LRYLYDNGLLDDNNRALYICYWPGIRYYIFRAIVIKII
jgi:hypothetical protein